MTDGPKSDAPAGGDGQLLDERVIDAHHPLDLFYDRALSMADRILAGEVDFIDGIDACYSAALWAGLVDRHGDDAVQRVLALAFIATPKGST